MAEPGDRATDPVMAPILSGAHWQRLIARATRAEVSAGDRLFSAGERNYPLVLIESGQVQLVREALAWADEEVVADLGPGAFAGDLGMLNGHASFLTARATTTGTAYLLNRQALQQAMREDDELADIILRALWARREFLRKSPTAQSLKLVGHGSSTEFLKLREFAERLDLAYTAVDLGAVGGTHPGHDLPRGDLPVAYLLGTPIVRATPGIVAELLGLSYEPDDGGEMDLVVIGGGPAGLASAIYGASEGLRTLLLDSVAPGGQAAATSRIENYLGFPFGVSGMDLIGQASLQAIKFGVQICAPCEATDLRPTDGGVVVTLSDGREIAARAALITAGASYRTLSLPRWAEFEETSIYYAATALEVKQVAGSPSVVVGGANSAGQASLYLAANGSPVHLVIRGDDIGARMSSYLANRIVEEQNITVHLGSQLMSLEGDDVLEAVTIDTAGRVDARGLFCFIGADPASAWIRDVARDAAGFILTGSDVVAGSGHAPLPFETSVPRVFAAGDIRHGSMKRVAAAVGEGSSAVASVHRALAGLT